MRRDEGTTTTSRESTVVDAVEAARVAVGAAIVASNTALLSPAENLQRQKLLGLLGRAAQELDIAGEVARGERR